MMIRIDVNVDEIVGVIQSIQSIISCLEEKTKSISTAVDSGMDEIRNQMNRLTALKSKASQINTKLEACKDEVNQSMQHSKQMLQHEKKEIEIVHYDEKGKKYIAVSNEQSSNESSIEGEKINHQYSKSFEFEEEFRWYINNYLEDHVQYFSMLRPLNELQIAKLFSNMKKYHKIFRSCNIGSKETPWKWCCNCSKCLFVFIILSPYLYKKKLVKIFKKDLYENKDLLNIFIELCGYGEVKPFECVGTPEEVNYAISRTIKQLETEGKELPYLLNYYKENYKLVDTNTDIEKRYNEENNVPKEFEKLLKDLIFNDENEKI